MFISFFCIAFTEENHRKYFLSLPCIIEHLSYFKLLFLHFLGFLEPSGGTAIVNGYDIQTDIAKVRKTLGLCPQHNILFDSLTVEEHLKFFAKVQ